MSMIFIPLPFVISISLLIVSILSFWPRKDRQINLPFFILTVVAIVQSFLIGLRWGYDIETFAIFGPVLAALIPPLVYLGITKLVRPDLQHQFHLIMVALPAILIVGLLFIYPRAIDAAIILIFAGYGLAILRLIQAGTDSLHLTPFESATAAYRTIIFASLTLLFWAMLEAVIYFEFAMSTNQNALFFITIGNISLLVILAIAAVKLGGSLNIPAEIAAVSSVETPLRASFSESTASTLEEHAQTLEAVENLIVSKRLYRETNLNLNRLARKLAMPARQVSEAINKVRDKNISQFVNEFRVVEACELLVNTEKPVTEIMFHVGFQTKSNFNREFRRVTGKTPVQWRSEKCRLNKLTHIAKGMKSQSQLKPSLSKEGSGQRS